LPYYKSLTSPDDDISVSANFGTTSSFCDLENDVVVCTPYNSNAGTYSITFKLTDTTSGKSSGTYTLKITIPAQAVSTPIVNTTKETNTTETDTKFADVKMTTVVSKPIVYMPMFANISSLLSNGTC
jgi:endoglucanase Acf2